MLETKYGDSSIKYTKFPFDKFSEFSINTLLVKKIVIIFLQFFISWNYNGNIYHIIPILQEFFFLGNYSLFNNIYVLLELFLVLCWHNFFIKHRATGLCGYIFQICQRLRYWTIIVQIYSIGIVGIKTKPRNHKTDNVHIK